MKTLILLAVVVSALAVSGCASMAERSAGYHSLRDVDRGPELIACSAYVPPQRGYRHRAEVTFDVTPDGAVVNPQAKDLSSTPLISVAELAARVARSCQYHPAIIDGEPVGVLGVRKRFTFTVEAP